MELLGQQAVMARLTHAARSGRLHHCYLFEGPPSVGKHTAAVRLAMLAACTTDSVESCPVAQQMKKGLHPDLIVLEPDPSRKSRTIGVNQVRKLISSLRLRPYAAAWRTVIVDPADALMPQAANALLKTLEEPPSDTGFVLVTSQSSALLPTVLSRSQRVRFNPVAEAELVPWLVQKDVSEPERVARLSMGCPGRALHLAQEGGLQDLDEARALLLELLDADPSSRAKQLESLSRSDKGKRRLGLVHDALETLLRDCVARASGRPLIHADREDLVERWSRALWPTGIERLHVALDTARQRLKIYVNRRLVDEALLAAVAKELA